MAGEDTELNVLHQTVEETDAYEQLIGDAMKGDLSLLSEDIAKGVSPWHDPVAAKQDIHPIAARPVQNGPSNAA